MSVRGVAVLGSTGSIGRTTLDVIGRYPDRFRVVALTARTSQEVLLQQVQRHRPELAVLADGDVPTEGIPEGTTLKSGWDAVLEAARHPEAEIVVNALVGAAGLEPTLLALEAAKRLALANKESLVIGGELVLRRLEEHGGELIPVDSEHSAIFQCLQGEDVNRVERLVLTASGGPFRDRTRADLADVTREEALRHPTWDMGAKITVDSATLANKALEVIEAHHLFGVAYDSIDVLLHPQSIVHSLVEFADGAVLAELGRPTMSLPILYALTYPERVSFEHPRLDLAEIGALTFDPVPAGRFPAYELGRQAGERGGTAPATFNAANEEAVAAFLADTLSFKEIPEVIERVMAEHRVERVDGLPTIRRADDWAREYARDQIAERTQKTGSLQR